MFDDEQALSLEQFALHHNAGDKRGIVKIKRGISKNKIELAAAKTKVAEHIALLRPHHLLVQALCRFVDKLHALEILLNSRHRSAAPRDKLQADVARAGKEVKHLQPLKVNHIIQHVEQALLGIVGGRPHGQVARWLQSAALIFSAYYPHRCWLNKL